MGAVTVTVPLSADARSVREARHVLRDALLRSGAEELVEPATLVTSEIVTNALVHAGTEVELRVLSTADAVRVEVQDGGEHVPVRRKYAETAGTGRGLQLVEELSDRWGVAHGSAGKAVWFEIGDLAGHGATEHGAPSPDRTAGGDRAGEPAMVTLLHVPLLMHVAWQEHAATLLREYLLHALDKDADIFAKHAQASEAMSLLNEQIPAPVLSNEPDALMAEAIEPDVSAEHLVLCVPRESVPHFSTLDDLLARAIAETRDGSMLSPPTQPEIDEMRQWLCREVAQQAAGNPTATPWMARTDVRATLADQHELTTTYAALASTDEPLLATDEASIIVAASPAALALLGYRESEELVGRRIIVVVPHRFHQAHIAGTTLHATNGRDNLLGVPLVVPMVHADGSEVAVNIEVRAERLDETHRVYVARFRPAG